MGLEAILKRVKAAVGGEIKFKSAYEGVVEATKVGDVRVKLDAVLFSEFKLRGFLRGLPLAKDQVDLTDAVESALVTEARRFVPFEIVFDPIPFDRISDLEPVRAALSGQAEETGASIYNAFG